MQSDADHVSSQHHIRRVVAVGNGVNKITSYQHGKFETPHCEGKKVLRLSLPLNGNFNTGKTLSL